MIKAELRRQFLQKRKALTSDEVRQRSEQISRFFFDLLFQKGFANTPATIHIFLPIQRQNEVDTWPIICGIWRNYNHINLAVSITNVAEHTLTHYPLSPRTPLVENRWGVPEPITTDQPVSPLSFDLVLVPLLAFDWQGQRIGYGGGYYDRFLAECRPDCLTVGLSFFGPVERIEATELTDIALKACLTAEQIYYFK